MIAYSSIAAIVANGTSRRVRIVGHAANIQVTLSINGQVFFESFDHKYIDVADLKPSNWEGIQKTKGNSGDFVDGFYPKKEA